MLQVRCRTWAAVAAAAAGVCGFGQVAAAAEPTQQELIDRVKALTAKVEQLEAARRPQSQPQSQSQPDARLDSAAGPASVGDEATLSTVLSDADLRSTPNMLQSGDFTAGYSKGKFLIQDAAGNFVLNPNVQLQARYVFNHRDASTADPDDSGETSQDGFELRRVKFALDGNLFGPGLTYKFQWATSRSNGQLLLEEAWARYNLRGTFGDSLKDWHVRVGQFKDITFHEETTSSKRQLAVERSLMNEVLAGGLTDYPQGVTFLWDDGPDGLPLRAEVGYLDGPNTDNTNFQNGGGLPATFPGLSPPSWGAVGRVEYLAMGTWKQYEDFTAMDNAESLLAFGLGAHYFEAGRGDVMFYTADAQFETGPLGLYGAYVGLYSEPEGGAATAGATNDFGFLVQAGYMLTDKWEIFGRYDHTVLDEDRLADGAEDSFPEITVGFNHYLNKHAAKITVDGVFLPNGAPSNENGTGLLDPDGDETQFAIRAQFQLLL